MTISDELMQKLKYLRFNMMAARWDDYLETARRGNFSHPRLLQYIVDQEYQCKKESSRARRVVRARIPEKFVMETFPFHQQPRLKKKELLHLYDSLGYMRNHQNIVWIGPTGVGKTGLATAFLLHAINQGYTGRFISFPQLVELFHQSIADHSEARVLKTFASYDCLLIDELGYVEVEPTGVGLFFSLMNTRHKKKSTLVTSNLGFSQWTEFLKNDHLASALIDRLTEDSYTINIRECVSLRAGMKAL